VERRYAPAEATAAAIVVIGKIAFEFPILTFRVNENRFLRIHVTSPL
jgi:hypothetical protein